MPEVSWIPVLWRLSSTLKYIVSQFVSSKILECENPIRNIA